MKKSVKSNLRLISSLALVAGLSFSQSSMAQETQSEQPQTDYTHYVTDSVQIPLRTQPGYKYKILRLLKSGTPVSILEVNDDGWTKLSYNYKGEDIIGWMPSSVLLNQPIARVRLAKQIEKTSHIEKKLNQALQEKSTLNSRFNDVNNELKKTKESNFKLQKQLTEIQSISGKTIELHEQNQQFMQDISKLKSDNAILKEQISQAGDVVQRQWFLTGGGVLLLGLLIGRFLRLPNRRNKWGSL
ncbi:TIGR04211 family SH3 domain-containing protein [Hydrogenovibrio kuenenii]|uniref:TIGR04211 family SH3 domain-containing protein n=1 Tax=Hydrogenovibrio kuenenii TaxID=63658 RepID=UPI0004673F77|nr:TIGR04211 family SH3 domain-containing protein [Hydrogenovibrio kuenenii]